MYIYNSISPAESEQSISGST